METATAVAVALPVVKGPHLLVKLYKTPEKIGSLYTPESRRVDENDASPLAVVVGIGPEAYIKTERWDFPAGPRCVVGDVILMKPLAGVRIMIGHGNAKEEYRIINDDSVLAVVPDPSVVSRSL